MKRLITGSVRPKPGDLVLARIDEIGKHTKLELTDGRRAHMFPGDEIVVCYGNRYAPDQFEAQIGTSLAPCDLVAAGGIASTEISRRNDLLPPTKISPIGLLADDDGNRLNVMQFRVDASADVPKIPAILSLGTSMNAGKTLTATSLVRGFKRLGLKVAALKITGTGAGGDMWIVQDAGADVSLDFTDAGFATTYLTSIPDLETATYRLMNHAYALGCDVAVIEIADGLHQLETAQLVRNSKILDVTIGTVFAAYDAMGAIYGVDLLRKIGHNVLGISGRLSRTPLGVREAEEASGLTAYAPLDLQEGALIPLLLNCAAEIPSHDQSKMRFLRKLTRLSAAEDTTAERMLPVNALGSNTVRASMVEATLARDVLDRTAHYAMNLEADALCKVDSRVSDECFSDLRKGFSLQYWVTDFGQINLHVPQLKSNSYTPDFIEKATISVASVLGVLEASKDKFSSAVSDLVETLTNTRFSSQALDGLVAELRRLIDETHEQRRPLTSPAAGFREWLQSTELRKSSSDNYALNDRNLAYIESAETENDGVGLMFQRHQAVLTTAAE